MLCVGELGRVWGIEFVLCVGQFCVGLGERVFAVCGTVWGGFLGVRLCCESENLGRVLGSEIVLCMGQFVVGLWE